MSSFQYVTLLESLPDELVVIILSFLHAVDRLRTFSNLNSRFDQCLREVGVGIEDDLATNDLILKKFASRIIFIRCYKRNEELELNQFPAIRSLTFFDVIWPQVASIDPLSMPYITHISLKSDSICNIDEKHTDLLGEVLCGKFPWLRWIHLSNGMFDYSNGLFNTFIPCFRIRSATIGFCPVTLFEILLIYLPNLIRLNIRIGDWHLVHRDENVKMMPDKWSHKSLHSLTLEIDFPFDEHDLNWLEQRLPVLMHLEVNNRYDRNHPLRHWFIEYITDDDDQ